MGKLSLEVLSNFPPISQSEEGARTGTWSTDYSYPPYHIFNQVHQRCVTAPGKLAIGGHFRHSLAVLVHCLLSRKAENRIGEYTGRPGIGNP